MWIPGSPLNEPLCLSFHVGIHVVGIRVGSLIEEAWAYRRSPESLRSTVLAGGSWSVLMESLRRPYLPPIFQGQI